MAASDLGRYQANLQDEIDGIALYQALSKVEADPTLAASTAGWLRPRSVMPSCGGARSGTPAAHWDRQRPAWANTVLIRLARALVRR